MNKPRIPDRLAAGLARGWKPAATLLAAAAIVGWMAAGRRERIAPGQVQALPGEPVPANAQLLTASNRLVATRVDVAGTVASASRIRLSSRLQAYVAQAPVVSGQSVKAGEPLIVLDDRDIREQIAAAQANLNRAKTEFQRARQLLDTKATTQQAYEAAESAFLAAQAEVRRAEILLTHTVITAPIAGVVTERRVEPGDLANPGQMLLTVYDPTAMRLEAPVPVRLLHRLSREDNVEIVLERPARAFVGRVEEIVAEIDPASRTQTVKFRLADATGDILPGTFGRVWIPADEHEALLLPRSAILRVGQLEMVTVVRDGRGLRRLVRTGPVRGDEVEILAGLEPGERVLADPLIRR